MRHEAGARGSEGAQVYRGGCRCGAVAFEVQLDLISPAPGSVWESWVRPGSFRLLSGDCELRGHAFASSASHHFFCERCGVRSFSRHHAGPCAPASYSIDLLCLFEVPPAAV